MSATPSKPAQVRDFKVLWYETVPARSIARASDGGQQRVRLPTRGKAKRKEIFTVRATTHVSARRLAIKHVTKRGYVPMCVNGTTRTDEMVMYTKGNV